jgi:cell wall-associated NlpC family hydrolase
MKKWLGVLVTALLSVLLAVSSVPAALAAPSAQYVAIVLKQAQSYCGIRYHWGGDLQWGSRTDCSGFVQFIYRSFGIELPRTARAQSECGHAIEPDFEVLAKGDLVFFRYHGRIRHVGIYLGNYLMLHCSSGAGCVTITDLRDYRLRIAKARRMW